jgi:hypothetical protein
MLKGFVAGILFTLLAVGATLSNEGYRVTFHLFAHYLEGSGEPLTLHLPKVLNQSCIRADGKWHAGSTSSYNTHYGYAFGDWTCTEEGGYDLYDFSYEDDPSICRNFERWVSPRTWDVVRASPRLIGLIYETPADIGRCIVGHGYGRPFEVHITK